MNSIKVDLLGQFRVTTPSTTLTRFRTQNAAVLLAYLSYYRGKSINRESLIELLWPDIDVEKGRARLRTELSCMRRELKAAGVNCDELLNTNHESVRLNPDYVTTDAAEFDRLVTIATAHSTEMTREWLESADALYQGEFLQDWYNDWAVELRHQYASRTEDLLRRLAASYEEQSDMDSSIRVLNRIVRESPYDDGYVCRLLTLYCNSGRLADARRTYDAYKNARYEEFGAEPSEEAKEIMASLADAPPDDRLPEPTFALRIRSKRTDAKDSVTVPPPPPSELSNQQPRRRLVLAAILIAGVCVLFSLGNLVLSQRINRISPQVLAAPSAPKRTPISLRALGQLKEPPTNATPQKVTKSSGFAGPVNDPLKLSEGHRRPQFPQKSAPEPSTQYVMFDVCDLGTKDPCPFSVNDGGYAVGAWRDTEGWTHAFIWRDGGIKSIPSGHDGPDSQFMAINREGQHVGAAAVEHPMGGRHAVRFDQGEARPLDLPSSSRSFASDINDSGTAVGYTSEENKTTEPFIYQNKQFYKLKTLSYGGRANAVSNESASVGNCFSRGCSRAVLWPRYGEGVCSTNDIAELPGLSEGASEAWDINDRSLVVGSAEDTSGHLQPVAWNVRAYPSLPKPLCLPLPKQCEQGAALAANDKGNIVGYGITSRGERALVWDDGRSVIDLNEAVEDPRGWVLERATTINIDGWIGVIGRQAGRYHAFVLIPIPKTFSTGLVVLPNSISSTAVHDGSRCRPTGIIRLDKPAASDMVFQLSSSNKLISEPIPQTVMISKGCRAAVFPISTNNVEQSLPIVITAASHSASYTASYMLTH